MRPEARPELLALAPAVHGGDAGDGVLDFSTGISPLPTPETIIDAARGADLGRYPPPTALPLRAAVGALHGLPPTQIVAGAGSVELIWALARAFGGDGRAGVIVTPAFGEYEQALRACGTTVITARMPGPRFELETAKLEAVLDARLDAPVAIVFVCRPSNPCLTASPTSDLMALARRWPRTLFVADEAYQPLFEEVAGLAPTPNLAVLRSLTKVFALPGLRLGYLLASPDVACAVQAALPPWNVSSPALAAGVAAAALLDSQAGVVRARIASLRRAMKEALWSVAGPPAKEGGPFLLYEVNGAELFTRRMLDEGIRVRACSSFGLPDHVRLGVRPESDQQALVRAWQRVYQTSETCRP